MKTPPMQCTHREDGTAVLVTVEHDPRQSYSRAVDPRATRYATEILRPRGGMWALSQVDRDQPVTPAGRALTVFRFEQFGTRWTA